MQWGIRHVTRNFSTAGEFSWNYSTLINISFTKILHFLPETLKSAFYIRNLTYITKIEIGQGRSFSPSPPLVTCLGTPLKNTIPLFFPKHPLKSGNCLSPLFRQSPTIYIGFFMTPLLKSDFSVNSHNILSLIHIPSFKSNSVLR